MSQTFQPSWSERITVMGKGVPNWSKKYSNECFCIIGISEHGGWRRLYPVPVNQYSGICLFDVIQAVVRDYNPETIRPETMKTVFGNEFIKVVDRVNSSHQKDIINEYTETGEFLHDDSWRNGKSIGMIKPLKVRTRGQKIFFKCRYDGCKGHNCEPFPFFKFDKVGRKLVLARKLDSGLRFVMGTVRYHPSKWIVISAIEVK